MPLESPLSSIDEKAAELNARYQNHAAISVLKHALTDPATGRCALVSSFGAESVVLLHMVSLIDRNLPVLFIDTGMLFSETIAYQHDLARELGLTGLKVIRPEPTVVFTRDAENLLHHYDPDACCALRKTEPLETALTGFSAWITGRKRYQGGQRQALPFFETDTATRIKINPLAHWAPGDVAEYITNNRLRRHPLVAKGFASIGCAPCTSAIKPDEDARAGRWRGAAKTECGIHFGPGGVQRGAGTQ